MNPMPIGVLAYNGFLSGLLSTWLGLLMVNIKPSFRKLLLAACVFAILSTCIRSLSNQLELIFILLLLVQAFIIIVSWNLNMVRALITAALGIIPLALSEALVASVTLNLFEQAPPGFFDNLLVWILVPLPQYLLVGVGIFIAIRFHMYLLDYPVLDMVTDPRRNKVILGLLTVLGCFLVLQSIWNITAFSRQSHFSKTLSLSQLGFCANITLVVAVVVTALLIKELFKLTNRESDYLAQLGYLQTLNELHTAFRAQNHDLINHFQTLYGFLQLGQSGEAQKYLAELMGDTLNSDQFVKVGVPGLSALFYIKSGLARANGIRFNVEISSPMKRVKIPDYELNNILGNLINNAFDYVKGLDYQNRVVNVKMSEGKNNNYIIEVLNPGIIPPHIIKKMFTPGFTTKPGDHSGLGLYIVRQLIEKYEGSMELLNTSGQVHFWICLPQKSKLNSEHGLPAGSNANERDNHPVFSG